MIPLYGRSPTPLERFQNFLATRSPYWLIKFMRFTVSVIAALIRFTLDLIQETIRTFSGKYS